jgi:hypothetical protein
VFDCPACGAAGEPDGTLTVIRHAPDCPVLAGQDWLRHENPEHYQFCATT